MIFQIIIANYFDKVSFNSFYLSLNEGSRFFLQCQVG